MTDYDVTEHAREMYSEYRFGRFNYSDARAQFEPLLFDVLAACGPETRLYDVGCGVGYWFDAYLRAGVTREHITGIDLVPANVNELKSRGFHAVVENAAHLSLPDAVSDMTICIGVINCADEPFEVFRQLARITKPGAPMYINVYNKLHPYYYIVHKATFPLRYLYWNWNRKVADVAYGMSKIVFQPLAYLALGKFLDEQTGKTMFMDQVITPRAHLFTKRMLQDYAARCGCTIERFRYNRYGLMLSAVMRRNG
jgi:SAM-dependent methyltransferase